MRLSQLIRRVSALQQAAPRIPPCRASKVAKVRGSIYMYV